MAHHGTNDELVEWQRPPTRRIAGGCAKSSAHGVVLEGKLFQCFIPWGGFESIHWPKSSTPEEDIGDFFDDATVRSHGQFIAVTLLHAKKHLGLKELGLQALADAYVRLQRKQPSSISQAIQDAQKYGELIERGSVRGQWRLTQKGEATAWACKGVSSGGPVDQSEDDDVLEEGAELSYINKWGELEPGMPNDRRFCADCRQRFLDYDGQCHACDMDAQKGKFKVREYLMACARCDENPIDEDSEGIACNECFRNV